jgi:hypothetical protein
MGLPRVKCASLLYGPGNRRVGVLTGFTYRYKTNSGQEITDAGIHNTTGVATTEFSADAIDPIGGMGVPMIEDMINNKEVSLSIAFVDGKIHVIDDANPVDFEITGEKASGTQKAKFNWTGGKPKITR